MKGRALATGSKVTVVITTFDRPDYLGECLASIRQQTLKDFRLVVLDNASAADYSDVLDRFRDLPLSYVRNERNIGAANNLAKAMRCYSDSRYLVVFHDDDLMHPRMLEWECELLESDPKIQFVSTELAVFDDGTAPPLARWANVELETEVYNDASDLARSLLGSGGLCFGSTMYRTSVLSQITFDEPRFSIISDRPFLLDVARLGKCALIRAPLVMYRHHPGQDTNTGRLSAKNLIELMKAYRAAFPATWGRADQVLFYHHAVNFLLRYGYDRLPPEERIGAVRFIQSCIRGGVLRLSDVRAGDLANLLRTDGRRVAPAAIDAARAVKRRFASRQPKAADTQEASLIDRRQARPPDE